MMTPHTLPRPDEKRSYVQQMFTQIARRYDFLNSIISLNLDAPWRWKMVRLAGLTGAEKILDIGTGSGVSAFALARALGPEGFVVGADFSHGMLQVAQHKLDHKERAKLNVHDAGRCAFVNADALELPFSDNQFDVITSAFVLRNLVDLSQGFREMARITRPGGRVIALEICRPDNPILKLLFNFYFYKWVPIVGGLLSRMEAYKYLPNSLTNFPIKDDLTRLMTDAGLRDCRYTLIAGGMASIYCGTR